MNHELVDCPVFLFKKTNNLLPTWTNSDFLIRTCSKPVITACVIWGRYKKFYIQLIFVHSLPTHLLGTDMTVNALYHFPQYCTQQCLHWHWWLAWCVPSPNHRSNILLLTEMPAGLQGWLLLSWQALLGSLVSVQPRPDRPVVPLRHKVLYRTGGPKGDQNCGLCYSPWPHPACALSHAGQSKASLSSIGGHSCSQAVISCGPKYPCCAMPMPTDSTRKMSLHTLFL